MSNKTPLYDLHVAAGGKMVDFAGWDMPLNYGSQIAEHNAVRQASGMFDVSHMTVIDLSGSGAQAFLGRVVANDVGKLDAPGKALYGALLNENGGVIDDLIVYRREAGYRAVVNASTRGKVLDWFAAQPHGEVTIAEQDLAMVAVQGPDALDRFSAVTGLADVAGIPAFAAREVLLHGGDAMVARTGYTGEDGVEVILPGAAACQLWQDLAAAGVSPAGLGARDTLRLEAGLNLYGQDMDDATSPLVSNLAWTVAWEPGDRAFIGREALEAEKAARPAAKLTGLVLEDKGVLRHGQEVITAAGTGLITSGIFSPTLGYSVALARLPRAAKGDCEVDVRGKRKRARIVRPPFVRHGQRVHD